MQQYELTLVFKPELTEEKADVVIDSLKLKPVARQVWGKRLLAYPIDNHKEGLYMHLSLSVSADSVKSIERSLILNNDIIRHLLVKAEKSK